MSVFLDGEAAYCEDGGESIWQLNCLHRYMCWNGREQIDTRYVVRTLDRVGKRNDGAIERRYQ